MCAKAAFEAWRSRRPSVEEIRVATQPLSESWK